jgi:hypothetical protein
VVIGAVIGRLYDRQAERTADPRFTKRMGVLLATGLIVGDSLLNVAFAGVVAGTGDPGAIALAGDDFVTWSILIGLGVFLALLAWLYRYTASMSVARPA